MSAQTIEDRMESAVKALRTATTPVGIAMARIDIAWCNWALVHDITEQLFGDPDWWRK